MYSIHSEFRIKCDAIKNIIITHLGLDDCEYPFCGKSTYQALFIVDDKTKISWSLIISHNEDIITTEFWFIPTKGTLVTQKSKQEINLYDDDVVDKIVNSLWIMKTDHEN